MLLDTHRQDIRRDREAARDWQTLKDTSSLIGATFPSCVDLATAVYRGETVDR